MDNSGTGAGNAMEEMTEIGLLLDFYGPLLTENRVRILRLWCEEDLSVSEIAQEVHISRQGVHDALRRGKAQLREYEGILGMAARYRRILDSVSACRSGLKRHAQLEWVADAIRQLDEIEGIER